MFKNFNRIKNPFIENIKTQRFLYSEKIDFLKIFRHFKKYLCSK